ncbi:MAG: energy-coupling factor transporter transmembrane component T [Peptoniphilaceae bacterium]|uniref:energy-coupling factor transporter transmembrane component T n=1 Tax=Parvimonas sp. TaxID=1944660 RepID=UPI0025D66695|nr:energy-coupling factor transporter transmembrane component T [Parvimonas sp.]MCI5997931.1 energy-coupling factor transporter transmembrane protein EcfT [Parvimonas sp.]MDD7764226.1 energy-coupling factor transporter transmembrane component T [Peptoniphilaceae bacterium]MDY3050432.1 energy-coupling factor transporter transmembrane component T [Parvimonas sp.]
MFNIKNILKQKLDFRTKLFMTFVISYTLLLGNLQQRYLIIAVITSLLPYFLLAWEKRYKESLRGFLIIFIAGFSQKYFIYRTEGLWSSLFLFITIIFLRMLPGITMGKYTLTTTDMSEIVYTLKKMHFPDQIIIPLIVMARFFYTVKEDYKQVKDAMYMHKLTTRSLIFKPFKLFEYRTVPLLMCLTRTADEVSVSALTRGLEIGLQRSSISDARFKFIDCFFLFLMFLLIIFYIRSKYA